MKIEPTQNVTPRSSPPSTADGGRSGDERFVWEALVPRLIDPSKLAIIQTLLREGRALTPAELAAAVDVKVELARYQCKSMTNAGVLEIVEPEPDIEGDGDEVSYFFPKPPQASSSPSPEPARA